MTEYTLGKGEDRSLMGFPFSVVVGSHLMLLLCGGALLWRGHDKFDRVFHDGRSLKRLQHGNPEPVVPAVACPDGAAVEEIQ